VAETLQSAPGLTTRLVYCEDINETFGDEVPLLSCSLPTPGPTEPAKTRAFLEGLLPEGRALRTMASKHGVLLLNDAPATIEDLTSLLGAYGWECAGAIMAIPHGTAPPTDARYQPLDDQAVAKRIGALPWHPLGNDPELDIRMSLGGAQPKLLLSRIDGRWHDAIASAPSTHILKPTVTWPFSAHNESLVMNLARMVKLTPVSSWVEYFAETPCLVTERYDRRMVDGEIVRLHQEDMCQALGIRPIDKYNVGKLNRRMVRLLREFTNTPSEQVMALFRQIAFRAIVGDEDGHGKNVSLMLDAGDVELAPLYDSLCTLAYPELNGKMVAPIGQQHYLAKVDRAALLEEASSMGLIEAEAREVLDELGTALRTAIESMPLELSSGWPSEELVGVINTRIDRLESGQQMGRHPLSKVWRSAGTEGVRSQPPDSGFVFNS
jgi:serine/threonine-protein kinase HipA